MTLRYKDVVHFDENYKIEKETDNLVMHSNMNLADGNMIHICDIPKSEWHGGGNLVTLSLMLKTADEVVIIFNTLKVGGGVGMDLHLLFGVLVFVLLKISLGSIGC